MKLQDLFSNDTKIVYPFAYGDELTPEMARENRKAALVFVIKTGEKNIYSCRIYLYGVVS